MPKLIKSQNFSMDKKYSIIIPANNEEKYIRNTLESALLTSAEEIIVINDGSTDRTKEIVLKLSKKYPKIKLINLKKNFGVLKAYQSGVKQAKNEILVFFDADIQNAQPWMFEKLKEPILKNQADLVIGSFNNFGRITEYTIRPLLKNFFPELAEIKQPLSGLFSIKKEIIKSFKLISNQKYGLIQIFLLAYLKKFKIKEVDLGEIIHDKRSDYAKISQAEDEVKVFLKILDSYFKKI